MPRKTPAFQFYASDFMSGVVGWNAEEIGVYIQLLCLQFDKGSVGEREKKHVIMTASKSVVDFVLEDKFTCEDGKYKNKRLAAVIEDYDEYRKKQAENGKRGGRPKKGSLSSRLTQTKPKQNPPHNPNETQTKPSISTTTTISTTNSNTNTKPMKESNQSEIDIAFSDWWSMYPNKQGKQKAVEKFKRLSESDRADLVTATENYTKLVDQGLNGGLFQQGITFINGTWRDFVNPDPGLLASGQKAGQQSAAESLIRKMEAQVNGTKTAGDGAKDKLYYARIANSAGGVVDGERLPSE